MKINSKKIVAFFVFFIMLVLPLNSFAITGDYIWTSRGNRDCSYTGRE